MKTRSRDQGRTAGVGLVKRPAPGFRAMGDTRRFRTFPSSPRNGKGQPVETSMPPPTAGRVAQEAVIRVRSFGLLADRRTSVSSSSALLPP